MRTAIRWLALVAFPLSIVLALVSINVLSLVFDIGHYERGQLEQGVLDSSGISASQLQATNQAIVRYFRFQRESLPDSLAATGADPYIFNQRELIHMEDVRDLINLVRQIGRIALAYVIMFCVSSFGLSGRAAFGRIGGLFLGSAGLMIALVAVVGVLTILDFSDLFLRFHLVSFSNEYWMLDPRTDNLIRMFPYGFWYSTMVTLISRIAVSAASLLVIGGVGIWLERRIR